MFGHQNNDDQANQGHMAPTADAPLTNQEPETIAPTPVASAPTVDDEAAASDYVMTDLPHIPTASTPVAPASAPPTIDLSSMAPAVNDAEVAVPAHHTGVVDDDLLELKQSALHELSPLIGHLEQTPEEKFRTTMMMIQASDDQSMLQAAFEAAKQITDEKARAQALLDVVNEINYFTQQTEH